jgi:tetratricopeptide (TPR) repeat protein
MNELDAEELFHLALKASEDGDRDKTITYLKKSIELDPQANSVYILAAEYAEIGMIQRAIEGMQQALELNPELWTAYIQLGLLFLTQNLAQEARNAWTPLLQSGPEEYLFHFGNGLTQLVDEKPEEALASLKQGISINESNPALNRDMSSIVENISTGLAAASDVDPSGSEIQTGTLDSMTPSSANTASGIAQPVDGAEETGTAQKQHVFLSNYGSGNDGN